MLQDRELDLLDLAGAGEGRGIGTVTPAADHLDDLGAGAVHQARRFIGTVPVARGLTDVERYENRAGALRIPANAQAGP